MSIADRPPIRPRAAAESPAQVSWFDVVVPLLLMAVCFFSGIGALGLTGPDEPRYAAIARSMARTGDWVTPRLNGEPWLEKPALYYWLAAAAFRIFGEGEFAMRLPSALAAVLATVVAAWAALRSYGLEAARLTLWMLPVTIALIGFSHSAGFDMLFAACLIATAAVAAEILQAKRPGGISKIAFGVLLGAATLAKGPAAILLCGGAVLLWSAAARRLGAAFRFLDPVCVLAFAAAALPWYTLCALRNPDFIRVFFVEHNVQRYLTPMFQHPQPFWFFGPILLAAVFPWTPLVVALFFDAFRSLRIGSWRDSPGVFFACWAIAPLLFFSFSESKLPGYILPAVPPLVLILAAGLSRRLRQPANSRIWLVLVGCGLPLLALSASIWLRQLPAGSGLAAPAAWTPLLALASLGGIACALLAIFGSARVATAGVAVLMGALVAATAVYALPRLDPYLSAREAAQITAGRTAPGENIFVLGVDRSLKFGLEYYLEREIPEWDGASDAPACLWTTPAIFAGKQRFGRMRSSVLGETAQGAWLVRIEPPMGR